MDFHAFTKDITDNGWQVFGTEVYEDGKLTHSFGDTEGLHELYSATKTIVSIAAGIVYDEGKIDFDRSILDYLPKAYVEKMKADRKSAFQKVTVRRLLTMSVAGMPFRAEGDDFLEFALSVLIEDPETPTFNYSNICTYLVCVALTEILQQDLGKFIEERIFAPLQITSFEYDRSPEGYFYGASWMRLSVHDLSKIGLLLYHGGEYGGKHIISREYCDMATSIQQMNREGGYGFFVWKYRDGFSINGKWKQKCYILPERGLVVTYLSHIEDNSHDLLLSMEKNILGIREEIYDDIAKDRNWKSVIPLEKGWSADQKFIVTDEDGKKLLLRISNNMEYDAKKKEYEIISKYGKLGFPMSSPVEFGTCRGGGYVYMLLTWVEGKDLEEVLPSLSEKDQYELGRQAGKILRQIHSVPLEKEDIPEKTKRERKLWQLSQYEESEALRQEGDEIPIKFVRDNIEKIWQEKPVYQHGDFHPGNLIYMEDGRIGVIDFNRWEVGDPYEEFYKLESFGVEISIPYCIGQIDAYFSSAADVVIPEDFWTALAVYVAHASLFSIKWAEKFGPESVENMARRYRSAMESYDHFRRTIPAWYSEKYRMK